MSVADTTVVTARIDAALKARLEALSRATKRSKSYLSAEAIAAYNLVIQNYPGTNSVPTAYYKRGLAQQQAGQTDAARASWETVAKNFPDSDAGRLARQQLSRIGTKP